MYGCVNDMDTVEATSVRIPDGILFVELEDILNSLPDPEDDECDEDDSFPEDEVPDAAASKVDGDITTTVCACDEGKCNGSSRTAAGALAAVAAIAAAFH